MPDVIKIKRSAVTNTPPALAEGEIAYSFLSKIGFIGKPDGTIDQVFGPGWFAPLASPTFTGSPVAPTQPNADNSAKLATTAWVRTYVSSLPGAGDMLKSTYDTNNDGIVDVAAVANAVAYANVTGKPSVFPSDIVNVSGLQAALDLKAPLASPVLTGVPVAPTPAAGDNSTKLATTAFVEARIQTVLGGVSPATLDTIFEIQTALGGDANFAATVTTGLAAKLAKASNLSDLANVATARTNLGLGSMATQNANAVAITGGTIDGITFDGGTF